MKNFIDLSKDESKINNVKDGIILDTNVWIFLQSASLATNNTGYQISHYMNSYKRLLESDTDIYTSEFIISEFINRSIRMSMQSYRNSIGKKNEPYNYKKDYCSTDDFENNYKSIIGIAYDEIWNTTKHLEISQDNLTRSLSNCSTNDFNDQIIINEAKDNNLPILTDDADYIKYAYYDDDLFIYSYNNLMNK